MSSGFDRAIQNLVQIIKESDKNKTFALDTQAEVLRVEDGTAWVHLPGGVDETPVKLTMNAQVGDVVQVRIAGGRAWLTGNATSPPTDDKVANQAMGAAASAQQEVTIVKEVVTENIKATNAKFEYVEADTAKIHDLEADEIHAGITYTNELIAENITAQDIVSDHAEIGDLDVNYAQIDAANINTAAIRSAWVDQMMVQTGLIAHEGTVYELDAIQVNASKIKTGTLDVERLIVSVPDSQDPTKIHKYMVHVDPSTGSPSYEKVDADVLEDLTITADKIVAEAITAEKITTENIVGSGGWINLRNGTFNYTNASTGNGISWDGQHLNIKANTITMGSSQQTLEQILAGMQSEIDGAIETWYESRDPLPDATHPNQSNTPASSWTTTDQKNNHLRDLYFNTTNGHSYRWAQVGNAYYWVQIEDADAIKALADAAAAQETADNGLALAGVKRRVFVATPVPPYDIGDLWMQGANGDIMKCKTAKAKGASYAAADWEKASKYTDDSNVYTKSDFSITPAQIISKVSANETNIAKKANSADVYTKTQTDSAINQKAGEIDISVTQKISEIEVGGRNLLRESASVAHEIGGYTFGWVANSSTLSVLEEILVDGVPTIHFRGVSNDAGGWRIPSITTLNVAPCELGETYMYSMELKIDRAVNNSGTAPVHYHRGFRQTDSILDVNMNTGDIPVTRITPNSDNVPANTWFKVVYQFTVPDEPPAANRPYPAIRPFVFGGVLKAAYTGEINVWMRGVKIEKGNKETNWTPAPEDTGAAIETTKAEIKVTTDSISAEVSKKVGNSEVISKINQSPESITINANKVNIEGATIFSSGRLSTTSLNNTYDGKGAAAGVQTNLDNMHVGGRNLVWDTEWKDVSHRWHAWGAPTTREIITVNGERFLHLVTTTARYQGYEQAEYYRNGINEIRAGEKIVVSLTAYAKTAGQKATIGIHWRNSAGSIIDQSWLADGGFTLTTTPARYVSPVWTVPSGAVGFNLMVGDTSSQVQELWISRVMMEKATKASDWSPAPEDLPNDLSSASGTTVINGGHITTGTIDASKATITNINASNISTGTLAAARIAVSDIKIGTAQVTSGVFDSARIPNLDASKITSGYISADRINANSIAIGKLDSATRNNINHAYLHTAVYYFGNTNIGWRKIGHLKSSNARTTVITLTSGAGYNGRSDQNTRLRITIKAGNGASTTTVFGTTVEREAGYDIKVKVIATATTSGAQECDVYWYCPWNYNDGEYTVSGYFQSWTNDTSAVSSEPTGNSQEVAYRLWTDNYITEIDSAGIKIHAALNPTTNYAQIDANGMDIYKGGVSVAKYGDTTRIGKAESANAGNVYIDNDSVDIRKGSTVLSTFTASGASIGRNSTTAAIDLLANSLKISGRYETLISANDTFIAEMMNQSSSSIKYMDVGVKNGGYLQATDSGVGLWVDGPADTNSSYIDLSTYGEITLASGGYSPSGDFKIGGSGVIYGTYDINNATMGVALSYYDESIGFESGTYIGAAESDSPYLHGLYSGSLVDWIIGLDGDSEKVFSPQIYTKTTSSGANVRVVTSGKGYLYRYVSSSRRYKEDIEELVNSELDAKRLYALRPVQFRYKDGYLEPDDPRCGKLVPGFIAEEVEEAYPIAAQYENEMVEDWEPKFIIPPMLKLIQEQNDRITELERRLS